jgi:hypothetical protein
MASLARAESSATPAADAPKYTRLEPAEMVISAAPAELGAVFTPAPHDYIHNLPEPAARRLELLRERSDSAFRMVPSFEEVSSASAERTKAENVWKRMVEHPSNFGFGRAQDDPLSLAARKTADRAAAAFAKIQALYNKRGEEAQAASAALKTCEDYLRSGKPGGTIFETVPAELPKLARGESLVEAVEKMRRRVRELRADAERIAASQYPAEVTKQKMREQIMRLAEQNAPDVSLLVEHFREVVFPAESQRAEVIGAPVVVSTVIPCSTGLLCWLHRDTIIARLEVEIDHAMDTSSKPLTSGEREIEIARIMTDIEDIERKESTLIFEGWHSGQFMNHRRDVGPLALLGLRLLSVVEPDARTVPGTVHSWEAP